jgi:SET family sugar efflux transporter-like MFS transporter
MFVSGLATSAVAPQIGLFLVRTLHASLPTAGLFYLTNVTAPLAGYLIGRRSDQTGRRLGLFRACAAAGCAGYLLIASSTQVWMVFAVNALVLGFAGASSSQLLATVHDRLATEPSTDGDGVLNVVRMALTGGWVIGPTAGSWFAGEFGLRPLLVAVAVCAAVQLPLVRRTESEPLATESLERQGRAMCRPGVRAMFPLLTFIALYVLVYSGEPIKYGYLPIYMLEQLHVSAAVRGAVIGVQPLVEFAIMPLSIIGARRVGPMRLMAGGALLCVTADVCFAVSGSVAGMFVGQLLMGGVWGIFASLGVIAAQRLLPQAVATASALFVGAPAIGSALGGLGGSVGVAALGLPHVFFVPASLALLASAGLAASGDRARLR